MTGSVNESQFYMWRTLFAVAHADNVVTDEEIKFMAEILEEVQFTEEQTNILKDDIVNAKNISAMFAGITNPKDRIQFFEFARDLVWVDGDFASEEQSAMIDLYKQHMSDTTVDELVGKVSLELEDEQVSEDWQQHPEGKETGLISMLSAFKNRFLGK